MYKEMVYSLQRTMYLPLYLEKTYLQYLPKALYVLNHLNPDLFIQMPVSRSYVYMTIIISGCRHNFTFRIIFPKFLSCLSIYSQNTTFICSSYTFLLIDPIS